MKSRARIVAGLRMLLALVILIVGGACSQALELKVASLPDFSAQDVGNTAECAVVRRFMELHPDIQLKRSTGLSIEGGSNTMDMVPMMQIAGDISPAVIYVCFRQSDTYVQKSFLRPLDDFVAGMDNEELARRVPPSVREVMYREGPDGKKHWYMLPISRLVRVLIYRRDRFAAAGLDPNRPPRTWREFEEYARRLTNPQAGAYGAYFTKGDVSSWDFANLVWSRGGDIVVKDSKGEWKPNFNTPETVDALYFYLRLNKLLWKGGDGRDYRGYVIRDMVGQITDPTSNCSMAIGYLGDRLNVYQPESVGFAPVPYPEGIGRSASEINCGMLGIYAGIKDPAVVRAAYQYISFLDSDEANAIRVKIYIQRGFGKFVNPVLLKQFGYTDYLKQVDKEWVKVYYDALVNGKPEPYGKNCSVVYKELSRPIEQALNDRQVIAALDRGDEQAVKGRLKTILATAQVETAKRMYGTLSPKAKTIRHWFTLFFLVLTFLGFGIATFILLRNFAKSAPPQLPGKTRRFAAYLILFPALASVALWQYYPLIKGTLIAFQDYSVMGSSSFVGVHNFSEVLFDAGFWHSVWITVAYTALYMVFAFLSPIVLALLLSEVPRGKMFYRTMFYMPAVLSGLVVTFLWKSFYRPSGILNGLLNILGIQITSSWLESPALAMAALLLPVIWAGMGPGSLIYLAAFKTIPDDLYEAAEVDGAGMRRKVWNITLPSIKMLIMINAVGAFIGAFMSSEMIFAMTGGGPYTPFGATEVVGLQLFYTAFVYLKFGVANAMAWVLGFMLIGFTMIQLRNLSRVEFKGGR
jgi:multiple sugar transport system permease protein